MTRRDRLKSAECASDRIEHLIRTHRRISTKVSDNCLRDILGGLEFAMWAGAPGAVLELGCNVGTTSLYIRRWLEEEKCSRSFHVYDSFEGLPALTEPDMVDGKSRYTKGDGCTRREVFERNFAEAGLALPHIHEGWFADADYPEQVAFAFFDGDTYQSILDSFRAVWPRMSPGGVIVVHDYGYHEWPGVAVAVREYCEPLGVKWVKGLSHTCRIVVPCDSSS